MGTSRPYCTIILGRFRHTDPRLPPQINILVDEKQNARLADFGLASALSNGTIAATHMTGGGGKGTVPSVSEGTGSFIHPLIPCPI
jgi:hypothetical protein